MSNLYEDTRFRVLFGQATMVLYSLMITFLGRSGKTFLLVFLLIIVFSILMARRGGKNPLGQEKVPPERVLEGKKLYEEKNTRELQTQDQGLLLDIQEQSRFSMYNMLGMVAAMAYFFLFWPHVDGLYSLVAAYLGEGKTAEFIAYLIYFEGLFIITQASYYWALRKVGKVPMIQMPQSYTVTDKGIVLQGMVGKTAVTFPLPDKARVAVNEKRKFVEIVVERKRTVTRLRLYARNPKRLYEIIRRYSRGGQ